MITKKVTEALNAGVLDYYHSMKKGVADGHITREQEVGVAIQSIMRAVDRIAALPDERDLTDEEVQLLQSYMIQLHVASGFLLHELPFPAGQFATVAARKN